MQLQLLGFTEATQRFASAAQASAAQALDFTLGSVLRAVAEANSAVGLWIQWQIIQVRGMTRLATSSGADVDSFVGDFGLVRLPGVTATGQVTLSRYAPVQAVSVLPGTLVRTADGTATVAITTDTTNSFWNTTSLSYVIPAGTFSATLPAAATVTGQAGNLAVNTLTLLATAIAVDTVTNAAPFAGGLDPESDAALQARFQAFIASLSKATESAILYAASAVEQGLALQVIEGPIGSGIVTLYADDGSGTVSPTLLASLTSAIDRVRPTSVRVVIQPPTLIQMAISIIMSYPSGAVPSEAEAAIETAVATYMAGLGMGMPLSYARMTQVVLDAAPPGSDIASMLINGGMVTIAVGAGQRAHLASLSVT